jgi:lipopolysaccharide export system permease protein
MLATRLAHAAPPSVAGAQDSAPARAAAPPVTGAQDSARKPATPPIPPSSGIRLGPEVIDATEPGSAPVILEGLKLQLLGAQSVIYGNQVEIEKKFAIATACVIFALLGAPIAFRFPRGGVGMTIGVSLVVFGVYYVGLIVGEELARRGYLPAFVAMWGTNAVLLILGVVLTARLGTEGATHRGSELADRIARWVDRVRRRADPGARAYP